MTPDGAVGPDTTTVIGTMRSSRWLFIGLAGVLVVSWSSGFVGIRYTTESASVVQVLFWRSLVSGVGLLPFAFRAGPKIDGSVIAEQILYAFLGMFLYLGGFAVAIGQGVPTGLVALMADLVPLAIAALSAPLLGERLVTTQWAGTAIGVVGVLLVSADALALGSSPLWAYALPILGMFSFAFSIVIQQRRHSAQSLSVVHRLCLQCLLVSVMFAPIAATNGGLVPPMSGGFAIGIGWLVVFATYGAWLTYYVSLKLYPAAVVSSVIYLSPPLTMVWSWAMFGEPLTVAMAVGLVVTLGGVALVASPRSNNFPRNGDRT